MAGLSGADGSALRITAAPSLAAGTPAPGGNVVFAIPVQNNGDDDYNGYFAMMFYADDDNTKSTVMTLTGACVVPGNTQTTVYIEGPVTEAFVLGNSYIGSAYYLGTDGYEKIFPSALKIRNEVSVIAQNITAIETLSPDGASSGPCYNLRGQRVSPESRGIFIHNGKLIIKQ